MNVLSLFDGMSCGRIALDRLGIEIDNYYASEIDKYSMKVSEANYPDIIQVGDVTQLDTSTLPKIDLIMGGSPCQGFSFAGKQLAFDDPRSALFFEFVRCVKELNPKYFLLENVRMKKEYLDVISEYMGVEPIMINSALVSAQNRVRYYWTNIQGIEQPQQRGIVLRDILETTPDNYTLMSNKFAKRQEGRKCLVDMNKEKAASLSAMEYVKNGRQGDYLACNNTGIPKVLAGAFRGRYNDDGTIKQHLELRQGGKTNSLTTVQKDNVVVTFSEDRIKKFKETLKDDPQPSVNGIIQLNNPSHSSGRVYSPEGKSPTLMAGNSGGGKEPVKINDDVYWRKLTPVECERLQTVPDDYTNHVSNTQRYKMLGNGWTIEVITHILKNIKGQVR